MGGQKRGMPLIIKNAPDVVFHEVGNLFIVSFTRPSFSVEEVRRQGGVNVTGRYDGDKRANGEKVGEKFTANQEAILRAISLDSGISARRRLDFTGPNDSGVIIMGVLP